MDYIRNEAFCYSFFNGKKKTGILNLFKITKNIS